MKKLTPTNRNNDLPVNSLPNNNSLLQSPSNASFLHDPTFVASPLPSSTSTLTLPPSVSAFSLPPSSHVPISFSTHSYATESTNVARELLLQKRTKYKTRRRSK